MLDKIPETRGQEAVTIHDRSGTAEVVDVNIRELSLRISRAEKSDRACANCSISDFKDQLIVVLFFLIDAQRRSNCFSTDDVILIGHVIKTSAGQNRGDPVYDADQFTPSSLVQNEPILLIGVTATESDTDAAVMMTQVDRQPIVSPLRRLLRMVLRQIRRVLINECRACCRRSLS